MSDLNYQKQAQEYYSKAPLIILGSGASAAHGMSGMRALAKHLTEKADISGLSASEIEAWKKFCAVLDTGVDLETALHQVVVSEELNSRIIKATWSLINAEDIRIFTESLGGFSDILPTLDTGEALVVGDASLLPSRIRIDEPKNKPNSGTVNFWDEWQKPVKDKRLSIAVDNWRKQNIQ